MFIKFKIYSHSPNFTGMNRMEELEQIDNKMDTYVLRKLEKNRLPTTPMKLEQMRAKDESITKHDQQIAKLSHLRLKIRSKRQNWSWNKELSNLLLIT